jgi:hypothetical protein
MGILFNPFLPFHLEKQTWLFIADRTPRYRILPQHNIEFENYTFSFV